VFVQSLFIHDGLDACGAGRDSPAFLSDAIQEITTCIRARLPGVPKRAGIANPLQRLRRTTAAAADDGG